MLDATTKPSEFEREAHPSGAGLAMVTACAVGVTLRVVHLVGAGGDPLLADLVMDSLEYHERAVAVAGGAWWPASPFFQPPLYPYLIGLLYAVFRADPVVVYVAQIVAAPVGWIALWAAGRRLTSSNVGISAAILAAVYWPFVFCDVQLAKESLAVVLVSVLLWLLVRGRDVDSWTIWLGAGVSVGIVVLLRENMLLVLPWLLPLCLFPRRGLPRMASRWGLVLGGVVLILAPVSWVNWRVGGSPLPTTFQGGVNFYIGNNPEADGTYRPIVAGRQVPSFERSGAVEVAERTTGRELSPAEVSSFWLDRSLRWIRDEPLAWTALMTRKLGLYWKWYEWPDAVDPEYVRRQSPLRYLPLVEFGGVTLLALVGAFMIRRDAVTWAPVLLWIPAWTMSVVVFFVFSRYRLPMVPALMLLAAVPLARSLESARRRPCVRTIGVALLAITTLLGPSLVRPEPRMDLTEYNLGAIELRRGHADAAAAHFRTAILHDPEMYLAWLNLGVVQVDMGAIGEALQSLERARALEPRAPDAAASLGAALLQSGFTDRAEQELLAAVALDPRHRDAWHNLSLVAARRGDLETAVSRNRHVLELDPEFEPALRTRDRLRRALDTQDRVIAPPP